jgi:tRNA threonylcarbamoyladenosine biosynthesis protein TsaE
MSGTEARAGDQVAAGVRMDQEALEAWGVRLGASLRPPAFLCLTGDLGAGKSVLARAVARGAGVRGAMPSPTYTILLRYPAAGGRVLVHLDLYRLEDPEELVELGWEELGAPDELVLVEWPERAGGALPADRWEIGLTAPVPGAAVRDVTVRRVGAPPPIPLPGAEEGA